MSADCIVDPILVGLALLLFLAYHIYLLFQIRCYPLKTAAGQVWISRQRWCEVIMRSHLIIEGAQTIRNTLMATTVLASTSLALSSVVIAFLASTAESLGLDSSDFLLKCDSIPDGYRFFTIIVFFSCAFFCYMQSIRSANHASYLIAIPIDPVAYSVTPAYVAKVLNRGAMFYTIGTRFFYLAFLAVLWLFGPVPTIIASIILVCILFIIDRYPDIHYHKRSQYNLVSASSQDVERHLT